MTSIKHGFQSEILRAVNSKSSLNFIHLAKNYDLRHVLRTVYNSVLDIIILLGEAVINTVFRRTPIMLRFDTKLVIMPALPIFCTMFFKVPGHCLLVALFI